MRVYREILPNSFLLILTGSGESSVAVLLLTEALEQACHSGKTSIWVDCSQVQQLSTLELAVLEHYSTELLVRGITLVVCHPPDSLSTALPKAHLLLAPSLLDAELQCRSAAMQPPWPLAA
ncbi:Anti-anti-sigma regulatory factor (antagonist of anti-sigma factor) [Hymenobacter gelipurpurascens]|uniref:Anti-anti-sigma regulatory factor (Antagonist of anti-sigma factor) n=1 Tax=Hymenobacter gelipurpurascens TaxID=89968 RepID=A0A212T1W3_9BACT|nr:STAS domain-containing protein [Hymenobacter gelipurpurascens]SNC59821.1 Anti-anti-sigma regulatory factor (antagonist of anti-sigma factor) [Hymenobacter gelipurpurascens]